MREIYIKTKAGLLPIGRKGENLATRVHLAETPAEGQAVTIYVLRNGDSVAYPASNVEITDSEIIWTVTSTDTGKSGRGKVQYRFSDSVTGEVIKTEIYHFVVGLAIDTETGPAPDPYETWLDSLTDLAGQAQVAVREAEDYAESASESAEQAEASAESAEQSASSAGTYAANAQTSATTATQKAAQAAASEANAQTYAEQAQASAGSAGASATSAGESAESASASAESASESKTDAEAARQQAYESAQSSRAYSDSASQSATAAHTSEVNAGQSATAASASASSASQSATTATAKASEASASATTATTKASEASASATSAQEARTGAETAQAGAESAAETAQAGADAVGLLKEQIYNSYPNVEAEAGSIVSITDGADGIPVKSLVVGIEPVQAGSGDPSPTNVRPISGWTGATVQRAGKNLLNLAESEMVSTGWNRRFPISLKAGTYIISCQNQFGASAKGGRIWLTDENGVTVIKLLAGGAFGNSAFVGTAVTISESEAEIIKNIQFELRANGATYNDIIVGNIQLELGSTATAYEPYQGETYDITFPSSAGTVYGGSLDVTNGVLTVDRAMVDLEAKSWSLVSNTYWRARLSGAKAVKLNNAPVNAICSTYRVLSANSAHNTNGAIGIASEGTSDTSYYIYCNNGSTSDTPTGTLVYELLTPVTYQLTPTEVTTLLGANNLWADTGDVSLAYRADTKLYIDEVFEDYQDDLADYADALAALG